MTTILLRRGTAAEWTAANPVLANGEVGVELAAGLTPDKLKIGDGSTTWDALPYSPTVGGGVGGAVNTVSAANGTIVVAGTPANPTVAVGSGIPQSSVSGLAVALGTKATDADVVKLTGPQTIADVKTFSSSPVVPAPTTGGQAVNKTHLDAAIAGVSGSGSTILGVPGGVDDTAMVHAGKTAAGVGGTLVFPSGIYVVTGLTASVANQHWEIRPGVTVKLKDAVNAPVIDVTANGVTVDGGGTLDGNRANQTSTSVGHSGLGTTACVRMKSVSNITVSGIAMINGGTQATFMDAVTNVVIDGCRITGCTPALNIKAVTIYDGIGNSSNIRITDNDIDARNPTGGCIGANISNARTLSELRITGNRLLVGNAGATATLGVELFTSGTGTITDATISDNLISGPAGVVAANQLFGVSVGGSSTGAANGDNSMTVSGNVIRNCPSTGIEVIGRGVTVTGNTLVNSGPLTVLAIDVPGGITGVSVVGNTVRDSIDVSYCFRIHGGTNGIYGLVVSGNSVRNNTAGNVMLIDGIVSGAVIAENTFADVNGGPGISIVGTMTDSIIAHNAIDMTGVGGSTHDGILLANAAIARLTIDGNIIKGASRHGIYGLSATTAVKITGNRISSCGSSGIQSDSAAARWTISDNDLHNNASYGVWFSVAGTNLLVVGNNAYTNTNGDYLLTGTTFAPFVVNGQTMTLP